MSGMFDKQLRRHITQAFQGLASRYDEGAWEQFQRLEKQHRRKKKTITLPGVSLAACLVLAIMGIPVWLYVNQPAPERASWPIAGKEALTSTKRPALTHPAVDPDSGLARTIREGAGSTQAPATENADRPVGNIPHVGQPSQESLPLARSPGKERGFFRQKNRLRGVKKGARPAPAGWSEPVSTLFPVDVLAARGVAKPGTSLPTATRLPHPALWPVTPAGQPEWETGEEKAGEERNFFAGPVALGLVISPQTPYASNARSALNMGGGVLSEFPITRNIGLNTGILLANQSLNRPQQAPTVLSTGSRQLQSTTLNLVGLDIPLNVHYSFAHRQKRNYYLGLGVSSLLLLKEQYTYTYSNFGTLGTPAREETEKRSAAVAGKMHWGQLMNVSFGLDYSLSPNLRLTVEPYVKLPFGAYTQEQLRLGSGGVHLQIRYRTGRKNTQTERATGQGDWK
jgi:hypothetical protein